MKQVKDPELSLQWLELLLWRGFDPWPGEFPHAVGPTKFLCIYIYIYTYIDIDMYIYLYIYIYRYRYVYIYIYQRLYSFIIRYHIHLQPFFVCVQILKFLFNKNTRGWHRGWVFITLWCPHCPLLCRSSNSSARLRPPPPHPTPGPQLYVPRGSRSRKR